MARVVPGNERSLRYFRRLGFRDQPPDGPLHLLVLDGPLPVSLPTPPALGSANEDADNEANIQFYTERLHRFGVDPRALDWGSAESQQLRFKVLAGVGALDNRSVLDVGCGLGDFWGWLRDAGIPVSYTGLDVTPAMIEAARRRFPGVRFEVGSLPGAAAGLGRFDYVCCSGMFARRRYEPQAFLEAQISAMFGLCDRAVAMNCLSGWAEEKDEGEFYADPTATLLFCRTLTPRVVLRHDYHPRDLTIYLYRGQNR